MVLFGQYEEGCGDLAVAAVEDPPWSLNGRRGFCTVSRTAGWLGTGRSEAEAERARCRVRTCSSNFGVLRKVGVLVPEELEGRVSGREGGRCCWRCEMRERGS